MRFVIITAADGRLRSTNIENSSNDA